MQDVVLSHFHYERTTRLITLRHEFAKSNPRAFSHVHVGKGIFLPRRGAMDNPLVAAKKEYETTGGMFLEHDKPEEILLAGVWLTGAVPRVYPEQNDPRGEPFAKGDRSVEADVPDDQSLVLPRGASYC